MDSNRFREALLETREFVYTLELVPGRGAIDFPVKSSETVPKGKTFGIG